MIKNDSINIWRNRVNKFFSKWEKIGEKLQNACNFQKRMWGIFKWTSVLSIYILLWFNSSYI